MTNKNITFRVPQEIAEWIDSEAEAKKLSTTDTLIEILKSVKEGTLFQTEPSATNRYQFLDDACLSLVWLEGEEWGFHCIQRAPKGGIIKKLGSGSPDHAKAICVKCKKLQDILKVTKALQKGDQATYYVCGAGGRQREDNIFECPYQDGKLKEVKQCKNENCAFFQERKVTLDDLRRTTSNKKKGG